jgi:nitrogen fixation protein FixH
LEMTMTNSNMQDPKAITGKTVLVWLLGFFAVIFTANAIFIWLALGSFPGVVVESSYKAGQAYNQDIAEAKAQSERGWQVEAGLVRTTETNARVEVSALDKANTPLAGLVFTATLRHPTHENGDVVVPLSEGSPGVYAAEVPRVSAGNWNLVLEARRGDTRVFRSENRAFLAN